MRMRAICWAIVCLWCFAPPAYSQSGVRTACNADEISRLPKETSAIQLFGADSNMLAMLSEFSALNSLQIEGGSISDSDVHLLLASNTGLRLIELDACPQVCGSFILMEYARPLYIEDLTLKRCTFRRLHRETHVRAGRALLARQCTLIGELEPLWVGTLLASLRPAQLTICPSPQWELALANTINKMDDLACLSIIGGDSSVECSLFVAQSVYSNVALRRLELDGVAINSALTSSLSKTVKLVELRIARTSSLDASALMMIADIRVRSLELIRTNAGDFGGKDVPLSPTLEALKIQMCPNATNLLRAASSHPNLRVLSIGILNKLSAADLRVLKGSKSIQVLEVTDSELVESAAQVAIAMSSLVELRVVRSDVNESVAEVRRLRKDCKVVIIDD